MFPFFPDRIRTLRLTGRPFQNENVRFYSPLSFSNTTELTPNIYKRQKSKNVSFGKEKKKEHNCYTQLDCRKKCGIKVDNCAYPSGTISENIKTLIPLLCHYANVISL